MNVKTIEVKKGQSFSNSKTEDPPITTSKVIDFVGDVKGELKKISWPSLEELQTYTKLVVGMTFFFGMGIYFMDLMIQGFLNGLSMLLSLIG